MENIPLYINILFILITFLTLFFFFKATHYSRRVMLVVLVWLTLVTLPSLNDFFVVTHTLPPRFAFLVIPPMLLISALFITTRGKQFLNGLDLKTLTLLHVVRIPVELVLHLLYQYKAVPELMTFEGRNFDILSGLTAPLIYYFGFVKGKLNDRWILVWNIACLLLLINIVGHAFLSVPSPFQQLAFSQPNKAVLYFPFVWLPACIVPLVLFSHLLAFNRILFSNRGATNKKTLRNWSTTAITTVK